MLQGQLGMLSKYHLPGGCESNARGEQDSDSQAPVIQLVVVSW